MSPTLRHFVYILRSKDGRYYTGYTTDLKRRLREHQAGIGAKFTRAFGADKIIYHQVFKTKPEALRREFQIKALSRTEKEILIKGKKKR